MKFSPKTVSRSVSHSLPVLALNTCHRIPLEQTQATNGVVDHLENEAGNEDPLYNSENNGLPEEEENQDVDESESDDVSRI